jgi:hypothetical protein
MRGEGGGKEGEGWVKGGGGEKKGEREGMVERRRG